MVAHDNVISRMMSELCEYCSFKNTAVGVKEEYEVTPEFDMNKRKELKKVYLKVVRVQTLQTMSSPSEQ